MSEDIFNAKAALIVCRECSGVMRYQGAGVYKCDDCGHEEMDDYGKVRAFLEKHGPSNVFEIAAGTDLSRTTIVNLLKDGRLEVCKASSSHLVCKRCGMAIRAGEYCFRCEEELKAMGAKNQKKGTYNMLKEEASEDKMRFLGGDKK